MKEYPNAYIQFLIEFHGTRDYYECHEILEEYWMEEKELHWQKLIQLAVAVYHERRKNFRGSLRLYKKVLRYLRTNPKKLHDVAIDIDRLKVIVKNRIKNVLEEAPYEPFNLPLTDDELIKYCISICEQKNIRWCHIENLDDEFFIHRHKYSE